MASGAVTNKPCKKYCKSFFQWNSNLLLILPMMLKVHCETNLQKPITQTQKKPKKGENTRSSSLFYK
jgi:hypothetical protein